MGESTESRVSTGLTMLDVALGGTTRLTGTGCVSSYGLKRPSFVVLAGTPGVGKTQVLKSICRHVTGDARSVLCVSNEIRADDETRAMMKVKRIRQVSMDQLWSGLERCPRSLLILDPVESMRPNATGRMSARQRAEGRVMTVCRRANAMAQEFGMIVIASVGVNKQGHVDPRVRHLADAVVLVSRVDGSMSFQALTNRYGALHAA
jgi:predicted ATP-dependent serine protease